MIRFLIIFFSLLMLLSVIAFADAPAPNIPPHNNPRLVDPPPRPPVGSAADKARRLFLAIQQDTPQSIVDFFLPRDAFALIKSIDNPNRRYDQLLRAYTEDIHELHVGIADISQATFERFELVRRGAWVGVREEGNRLPYWASRHSWIHYRVRGQARRFEVRVLITWNDQWYITHLNEFH